MWLSERGKASLEEVRNMPDMKPVIEQIVGDVLIHHDNGVMRAVQDCGINVDKERLLKALTDARAFYDEGYAAGQTAQQKWIPVTERLPEEHDSIFAKIYGTDGWTSSMFRKVSKEVLVCIEYEDGSKKVTMIRTKDGQWAQTTAFRGTVTHWMPLPQPPKEGE